MFAFDACCIPGNLLGMWLIRESQTVDDRHIGKAMRVYMVSIATGIKAVTKTVSSNKNITKCLKKKKIKKLQTLCQSLLSLLLRILWLHFTIGAYWEHVIFLVLIQNYLQKYDFYCKSWWMLSFPCEIKYFETSHIPNLSTCGIAVA